MRNNSSKYPFLGNRFIYPTTSDTHGMLSISLQSKKIIEHKIKKGVYKFINCKCFCGYEDDLLVSEVDRYGLYYPMVLCRVCGIVRANPRLTDKSYISFYKNEYRTLYGDDDKNNELVFESKVKQGKIVFDLISKRISLSENATVFEIGCFMGATLLPFKKNGYNVKGVDFSEKYIHYGRKRTALNLKVGGVDKLKEFGEKADLIIINHVFEHFLDLKTEIKNIVELLNPGGYVFISVPGTFWWIDNMCGKNIIGLLQNAHTWQFSLVTLSYVMECFGFNIIFGNEEILSIFQYSAKKKRDPSEVPVGESERVTRYLKKLENNYQIKKFPKRMLEIMGIKDLVKSMVLKKKKRY